MCVCVFVCIVCLILYHNNTIHDVHCCHDILILIFITVYKIYSN